MKPIKMLEHEELHARYTDEWFALTGYVGHRVHIDAAKDPGTPGWVLARLADNPWRIVQEQVAGNPSTPPATLEKLAESAQMMVLQAVARNPAGTEDALRILSNHPTYNLRWSVARHPATPHDVLERLSYEETGIAEQVAANPNTSPETLHHIAQARRSTDVCLINVALNSNAQLRTLRILLTGAAGAREGVACHPNADVDILEKLVCDENENVRITLGAFAQQREILARLADDESAMVRRTVAKSRYTDEAVLAKLATDPEDRVRIGAAGNVNTPKGVLDRLATDESENVRRTVFVNMSY